MFYVPYIDIVAVYEFLHLYVVDKIFLLVVLPCLFVGELPSSKFIKDAF